MNKEKARIIRTISLVLAIFTLMFSGIGGVRAAEIQPRASDYLSSYNAYVYPAGGGEIRVYFTAMGTGYMDELGALCIEIHESSDGVNWDWVDTFNQDTTAGMLSYNDNYHSGYVSYDGIPGFYYKAYVCIWGGKDGDGDTRYFWTSAKLAT